MSRSPDIPRSTNLLDTIGGLRKPTTQTDDGWIMVGDPNDEISPAWQNDWFHVNPSKPVSFFLDPNGVVRFRGEAEGGVDGTVAFTLPVGYRPEIVMSFLGAASTGDGISRLQVEPNGDVRIMASGTLVTVSGDIDGTLSDVTIKPGADGFWKTVSGVLTRVSFAVRLRKNSTGSDFARGRINLIEGSNVTITMADDPGNDEIDVTIAASGGGGGGGSVATDTIFDTKGDLPVGTGSDTAAKLPAGTNGWYLKANSAATTGLEYDLPYGHIYDRVEQTTDLFVTATTQATAQAFLTGNSVTYDGVTRVLLEWYSVAIYLGSGTVGVWVATLYDGSSNASKIIGQGDAAGAVTWTGYGSYSFVPSAAPHAWSVRFYKSGAGQPVITGDGGGSYSPAWLRVTKDK
jgi:hypothetical protein